MSSNPSNLVNEAPLRRAQILVIIVCTLLNALDGFDILSISFAAPGIAADWSISRAALGVVLSAEIVGMAVGSILLGWLADSLGRRPTTLICLLIMSSGMLLASTASGLVELGIFRLYTGLGIGGMLAVTNAFVAEYTNIKVRTLAITIMTAGFPMGAIFGGFVVEALLHHYPWRAIFTFGAAATAVMIPIVWLTLHESVAFLEKARPKDALEKINHNLKRMGLNTVDRLPEAPTQQRKPGITALFSKTNIRTTLLLTFAYFSHSITFYFILKWTPKIVADMGFHPASAATVLIYASAGGLLGAIVIGLLSRCYKVEILLVTTLLFSGVMVAILGRSPADLTALSYIVAIAGFFCNAAVSTQFALLAKSYSSELRASGTGFAIGVGRIGGALGPVLAGYLFSAGLSLATVASLLGIGSLIAAAALIVLFSISKPLLTTNNTEVC